MVNKKITHIFWDVGAVLFSEAQISRQEFKPVRKLLGISSEKSDEIFDRLWPIEVRLGKVKENTYWKEYLKYSKRKPAISEIKKLYRSRIRPNRELLALTKNLSKRYEQAILSNHGREWMRFLVTHWKLRKWFKGIFCSAWLGVAKPELKFYKIALARTGATAAQVLYIDDNEDNVKVAESLRILSIVYKGNKDLIKKLSRLGIIGK